MLCVFYSYLHLLPGELYNLPPWPHLQSSPMALFLGLFPCRLHEIFPRKQTMVMSATVENSPCWDVHGSLFHKPVFMLDVKLLQVR